MRKKYLILWMAVAIVSGMTGCGKKTEDVPVSTQAEASVTEEDTEQEDQESSEVEKEDVGQDETGGEDVSKEEAADVPELSFTTHYYDAGEDNQYLYGKYQTAEVRGDMYPELKASVAEWFGTYEANYKDDVEKFLPDARMQAEDMGEDFMKFSYEYSANATRVDANITSIALDESTYTGGAHGYDYLYGVTFDTKTGKELQFSDLGDIREEVKSYVDDRIQKEREQGASFEVYEDSIDEILDNPSWYLDGIGFNIVFNAYDIGSYAEGRIVIAVPYEKLPGFEKEYLPSGNVMFARMSPSAVADMDVDGDGETESVEICTEYDDNGETVLGVKVNEKSLELGTCSYMRSAYYAKCDNKRSYILISCDMMSDDYCTYLVEVTDGEPTFCERLDVGEVNCIFNDGVMISGYVYTLGTYSGLRRYTFAGGAFEAVDERFTFENGKGGSARSGPVLKQALTVQVDEDGEMIEKELEAGTRIYPVNTDGEGVIGFELEDGTYGEIAFERRDGTLYIDDISEYDLFDELPYVG